MTRRSKIVLWGVVGALLTLVIIVLILIPGSQNRYVRIEWHFCLKCGMMRTVEEVYYLSPRELIRRSTTLQDTNLSKWYVQHFGPGCEHSWREFDFYEGQYRSVLGFKFRATGSESGITRTTYIELPAFERDRLDAKFRADKEACRKFIAEELKGGMDPPTGMERP